MITSRIGPLTKHGLLASGLIALLLTAPFAIAQPKDGSPATPGITTSAQLTQFLEEHRYLEFEQTFHAAGGLSATDRRFFSGVLAELKNQTAESLQLLQPLLVRHPASELTAAQYKQGWLALVGDYFRCCQYGKSADACAMVLQHSTALLDATEKQDLAGEFWFLHDLRHFPAQRVKITGQVTIQTKRNAFGHIEAPVEVGGKTLFAVLDTAAETTAISRSLAVQLGLKISGKNASGKGCTGARIQVQVARIPRLQIGRAEIRNVAAAVLEDNDLLQEHPINMLLGHPEIAALGRVTYYADGRFCADPARLMEGAEVWMDENRPLIVGRTGKGPRLFLLDSGMDDCSLSCLYWKDIQDTRVGNKPESYRFWGAGGTREIPAVNAGDVALIFGTTPVVLHETMVLTQPAGANPKERIYGIVGQSLLQSLRSWTLDYRTMHFQIDNGANH